MQLVRDAAVIPLTKFIAKIGVAERITEPGKIFTVVAHDIAIVQHNDLTLVAS
jgi:hypothetical protein